MAQSGHWQGLGALHTFAFAPLALVMAAPHVAIWCSPEALRSNKIHAFTSPVRTPVAVT